MIELLRREGEPPLRIGHRGAAALAPENTLGSFERALEAGVDLIEFDVLALDDGALVLAHSEELVGAGVPTLDEACAFLASRAPGVGAHVDLKRAGYERGVVEALRRHGLVGRALVTSHFAGSLRAVAALEPGLRLGLSYPLDRAGVGRRRAAAPFLGAGAAALRRALPYRIGRRLDAAGATVAALQHRLVSRAVFRSCHDRGAAVLAWTVDDPAVARALAAAGVDGIVTNDPRIVPATLPP